MASLDLETYVLENLAHVFPGVRHELGNPLSSIKMALTVLHSQVEVLSALQIAEYAAAMLGEVARMEGLLRSLGGFSPPAGLEPRRIDLELLLKDLRPLLKGPLEQAGVVLHWQSEAALVRVEPRNLQQVLLGLLRNAIEGARDAGEPRIDLHVGRRRGGVGIRIEGPGVRTADGAEAAARRRAARIELCRRLLAAMGGALVVESSGQSSAVCVVLEDASS